MNIKKFEFNMFPVNCYLLWDNTNEAVIIDAGCFFEKEKQELLDFIADNKLTVKRLINTHLHIDHVLGNPFIYKHFGLKSEAHKADEFWLDGLIQQGRMFGFELEEEPVPLEKHLNEGDVITFGESALECIHVPGHSPGSIVFHHKESHSLFSGDVLFQGSIGRADLEGGNFEDLKKNIIQKLFILPSESVIYPGHGPKTTIGNEKKYNPFFTNINNL